MIKYTEQLEYLLNNLGEFANVKTYKKNDLIFNESDIEENIYFVKSGKVEVYKLTKNWEERLVFILSDGQTLNEEVIFSKTSECSTCCRAYDNVKVVTIPKNILSKQMQKDHKVLQYIFECSSSKLTRTYRQLKNSGTNVTIDKKIASKLWKMALDYGIETKEGIFIDISLSSAILSKMVGAKRETVSRSINTFKKDGILKLEGDRITILDFKALSEKFEHS